MVHKLKKFDPIIWAASFFLGFFVTAKEFMPYIEGALFPVVIDVHLIEHKSAPPPPWRTIWTADAKKERDCSYIVGSIQWYIGTPDGNKQAVQSKFNDKPQLRTAGVLEWEDLSVDLDPETTKENSYSTVRHQCSWRWWQTESLFFVSQ